MIQAWGSEYEAVLHVTGRDGGEGDQRHGGFRCALRGQLWHDIEVRAEPQGDAGPGLKVCLLDAEAMSMLAVLDERIEALRSIERREALAQGLIDRFVLSLREEFDGAAVRPVVSRPAVVQPARDPKVYGVYRDPATGQTWDGAARQPKWLKGKQCELYLVIG